MTVEHRCVAGSEHDAADHVPATQPPEWRCKRCGSNKWVAASLTGGITRIRQCVPCGRYSSDPVDAVDDSSDPDTQPPTRETPYEHGVYWCDACGHDHAGPRLGGICVGCPCVRVVLEPPSSSDETADEVERLLIQVAGMPVHHAQELAEMVLAASKRRWRDRIADEINLEAAHHPGVEADASDFNLGVYNGFRHAARIARGIAERLTRGGSQ